jgi:hypothetical protein
MPKFHLVREQLYSKHVIIFIPIHKNFDKCNHNNKTTFIISAPFFMYYFSNFFQMLQFFIILLFDALSNILCKNMEYFGLNLMNFFSILFILRKT